MNVSRVFKLGLMLGLFSSLSFANNNHWTCQWSGNLELYIDSGSWKIVPSQNSSLMTLDCATVDHGESAPYYVPSIGHVGYAGGMIDFVEQPAVDVQMKGSVNGVPLDVCAHAAKYIQDGTRGDCGNRGLLSVSYGQGFSSCIGTKRCFVNAYGWYMYAGGVTDSSDFRCGVDYYTQGITPPPNTTPSNPQIWKFAGYPCTTRDIPKISKILIETPMLPSVTFPLQSYHRFWGIKKVNVPRGLRAVTCTPSTGGWKVLQTANGQSTFQGSGANGQAILGKWQEIFLDCSESAASISSAILKIYVWYLTDGTELKHITSGITGGGSTVQWYDMSNNGWTCRASTI